MRKIMIISGFLFVFVTAVAQTKDRTDLNMMTFNIRYGNPDDGLNNWKFRKESVIKLIQFQEVDVLGAQEVLSSQLKEITTQLQEYAAIGVGREDGKEKGEYSPILYKKDKFTLLKSGYFWLSQTPEEPSKGWDAACERIATWAQLKDKATGTKFFVLNTHFDHIGAVAREESVKLILNKTAELSEGLPQIVMGDFNAKPESSVVQGIVRPINAIGLFDSKKRALLVYGPDWSFHDFGRIPFAERPLIDYIFISKNITVLKYGVLAETVDEYFLSDHTPVLVKVSL
jgi:endonuclease/exonuclease/phosphatase family metal-dependent hydrolase